MGNEPSYDAPTTHPRFSKVQYSSQNNSMLISQPFLSKTKQVDQWEEKRKMVGHLYRSPSIFACKDYHIELNGTCSERGVFVGCYDGIFNTSLKEEIKIRSQEKRYFTEQQIWYFILFVSKTAKEIYSKGDHHFIGNIHPNNILINRNAEYKLIVANYSISLPSLLNHFNEYQINGDSYAFVSPEMLGFLYSTKYADYPNYPKCISKQAAEAFCFGLTLLSMGTLIQQMAKIYKKYVQPISLRNGKNIKNGNTKMMNSSFSLSANDSKMINNASISFSSDVDYLSTLLGKIKDRYSNVLYQLIFRLTEQNPDTRINIDSVYYTLLKPVERNIMKFDKGWIERLKEKDTVNQVNQQQSKQICDIWARGLSNILKDSEKGFSYVLKDQEK